MFEYEEAQFRLGWLAAETLPDVAIRMLEAGFDSQALREVAGLHRPTLRDVGDRFEEALSVLARAPMTSSAALQYVRQATIEGLASGDIGVEAGLRLMRDVWSADGCSAELAIFVGLEDEYRDHPDARALVVADVKEAAQALLGNRVPHRAR